MALRQIQQILYLFAKVFVFSWTNPFIYSLNVLIVPKQNLQEMNYKSDAGEERKNETRLAFE